MDEPTEETARRRGPPEGAAHEIAGRWRRRTKLRAWLAEHEHSLGHRKPAGASRWRPEPVDGRIVRKRWTFGSKLAEWLCERMNERAWEHEMHAYVPPAPPREH